MIISLLVVELQEEVGLTISLLINLDHQSEDLLQNLKLEIIKMMQGKHHQNHVEMLEVKILKND